MNKAFWSHFKHFGRLLGKIYLFILTPSKTDGRVPSQQGAPTTCNLTYWDISQQTYVQRLLLASLGVVIGQRFLTNSTYYLFYTPNALRHPELSISQQQFPSKDVLIFPYLPASKNLPEEQIHWVPVNQRGGFGHIGFSHSLFTVIKRRISVAH